MIDAKHGINFSRELNVEFDPFMYLSAAIPSDIIFGKKIESYTIIKIPRSPTKK